MCIFIIQYMSFMKIYVSIFLISIVLFSWVTSCKKFENESNISEWNEDESHENGENCMNCHYSYGEGEGWFSVAGTAQGNFSKTSVVVKSALSGNVLATIPVDELGNFYTTENIDIADGIKVDIYDANGNLHLRMNEIIYTGECNLCHDGKEQSKLVF